MKVLAVVACVLFATNLVCSQVSDDLGFVDADPIEEEIGDVLTPIKGNLDMVGAAEGDPVPDDVEKIMDDLPDAQEELNEAMKSGKFKDLPPVGMPEIPLDQLASWGPLALVNLKETLQGKYCEPGSPMKKKKYFCEVVCKCIDSKWNCTFNVCTNILGIADFDFDLMDKK